jgi:hypothetical protein
LRLAHMCIELGVASSAKLSYANIEIRAGEHPHILV